jgi:hypothetical protein
VSRGSWSQRSVVTSRNGAAPSSCDGAARCFPDVAEPRLRNGSALPPTVVRIQVATPCRSVAKRRASSRAYLTHERRDRRLRAMREIRNRAAVGAGNVRSDSWVSSSKIHTSEGRRRPDPCHALASPRDDETTSWQSDRTAGTRHVRICTNHFGESESVLSAQSNIGHNFRAVKNSLVFLPATSGSPCAPNRTIWLRQRGRAGSVATEMAESARRDREKNLARGIDLLPALRRIDGFFNPQ